MDLKQAAISISMIVFVLSSMLGMGLGLRVWQRQSVERATSEAAIDRT